MGSAVPRFRGSRFGGPQPFDREATGFDRRSSFGQGDFSLASDLFGWALGLSTFGLRGLNLLVFGLDGLNLLSSSVGSFSWDSGLDSPPWGPPYAFCPAYSTGNWACTP
jgi:hypothetical protein